MADITGIILGHPGVIQAMDIMVEVMVEVTGLDGVQVKHVLGAAAPLLAMGTVHTLADVAGIR